MRTGLIIMMAASAAGCVSTVSEGFDAAPDWFNDRRSELSGEGYPSLTTVADMEAEEANQPWKEIKTELSEAQTELETEAPEPVTVTGDDMRAWAAAQQAIVAKGEEPY